MNLKEDQKILAMIKERESRDNGVRHSISDLEEIALEVKGKELVIKQLDILVEMAEHCKSMAIPEIGVKCSGCALCWNFKITNHGCFLVETVTGNDKFISDLESACIYHDIDYKDKLNKVADIFVTECD